MPAYSVGWLPSCRATLPEDPPPHRYQAHPGGRSGGGRVSPAARRLCGHFQVKDDILSRLPFYF